MLTALEDEINERTGKTGPEKSSTPEPRITKGRFAGLDLTEKVAEGLFQLSQPIAPFHILPEDGGDATQPPGASPWASLPSGRPSIKPTVHLPLRLREPRLVIGKMSAWQRLHLTPRVGHNHRREGCQPPRHSHLDCRCRCAGQGIEQSQDGAPGSGVHRHAVPNRVGVNSRSRIGRWREY